MCTTCESEPEPNHHGTAGTRALKAPCARPPRRIWPTLDWPGAVPPIAAPRPDLPADEARSAQDGASRSCTGRMTTACAAPSVQGCAGAGWAPPPARTYGRPALWACRARGRCAAKGGRSLPAARASARPARRRTDQRDTRARRRSRGGASHWLTTSPIGTQTAIKHSATGPEVPPARSRAADAGRPLLLTFGWWTGRGEAPNGLTRRQVNVSADGWSVQASVTEMCATCNTRRVCPVSPVSRWKVWVCGRRAARNHRTPVHGPLP